MIGPFGRAMHWTLDGQTPKPCADLLEWAVWFAEADRAVRRTEVHNPQAAPVIVSTVFLGLDSNYHDDGPPILFETMVFGGRLDEAQHRYATWDEAVAGHEVIVEMMTARSPERA